MAPPAYGRLALPQRAEEDLRVALGAHRARVLLTLKTLLARLAGERRDEAGDDALATPGRVLHPPAVSAPPAPAATAAVYNPRGDDEHRRRLR